MSNTEEKEILFKTKYDKKIYIDLMKSTSKEVYYAKKIYDNHKKKYVYHPDYAILLIVNKDGTCNIKTNENKIINIKLKYIEYIPDNVYSKSDNNLIYEKESYEKLDKFINKLKKKWNKSSNKSLSRKRKNSNNLKSKKNKHRVKKPRFTVKLKKTQALEDINKIKKDVSEFEVNDNTVIKISKSQYNKIWNNEEIKLFQKGLKKYGKGSWTQISNLIKNKSNKQVRNYYYNTLKTNNLNKDNSDNYRKHLLVEELKSNISKELEKDSKKIKEIFNKSEEIVNKTNKKMFEMNKELKILKEKNRQTDIKNKELLSYLKKMTDQLNIIQEQSNMQQRFIENLLSSRNLYFQPNMFYQYPYQQFIP